MSIATEIQRLQTAKADIKSAIEAKGVTVPSNALIDTYDDYVAQISGGGSRGTHGFILPDGFYNLDNIDVSELNLPKPIYHLVQFYKEDLLSAPLSLGYGEGANPSVYRLSVDADGMAHIEDVIPISSGYVTSDSIMTSLPNGANLLCVYLNASLVRTTTSLNKHLVPSIEVYDYGLMFEPNSANVNNDMPGNVGQRTRKLYLNSCTIKGGPYKLFGDEESALESIILDGCTFTSAALNWDLFIYNVRTLYSLVMKNCTSANPIVSVGRALCGCTNLRTLDVSCLDFSSITTQGNFLKNNYELVNFSGVNVTCDLDLSTMYSLSHQSAINVLNALETVNTNKTITLYQGVKNMLTASEIEIATSKGWTVA